MVDRYHNVPNEPRAVLATIGSDRCGHIMGQTLLLN